MNDTTGADAKVITGKELKTWDSAYGDIAQTLSNTKNGVNTVMVGSIIDGDESYGSESGNYGIITSDPETVKINGSSYKSFKLWNGSEDVVTIAKSGEMNDADKGDVVSFDTDGSEGDTPKIKNLDVISDAAAMLGAEKNGSKYDVTLTPTGDKDDQDTYTADSDTTILYISDESGIKGGDITDYSAQESSIDGVFVKNAVYVLDGTDIDLIVIDVRGKLALSKDLAVASGVTNVELSKKTIKMTVGTDLTTDHSATIKGYFSNVLAVSKIANDKYTVVANDGSEYTFTVSVATE